MDRRPLPSANLGFLSTIMWDGRDQRFNVGFTDQEKQDLANFLATL